MIIMRFSPFCAWIPVFQELLTDNDARNAYRTLFLYTQTVWDIAPEDLRAFASGTGNVATEELMTTAERLRQEGLKQGRAEGHAEGLEQGHAKGLEQGQAQGQVQALLAQCTTKFGNVTASQRQRLQSCDDVTLRRALNNILSAETFGDLFD